MTLSMNLIIVVAAISIVLGAICAVSTLLEEQSERKARDQEEKT